MLAGALTASAVAALAATIETAAPAGESPATVETAEADLVTPRLPREWRWTPSGVATEHMFPRAS